MHSYLYYKLRVFSILVRCIFMISVAGYQLRMFQSPYNIWLDFLVSQTDLTYGIKATK